MFNITMLNEIISHFVPETDHIEIIYNRYDITVFINGGYMDHIVYMNFNKNKFIINVDGYDHCVIDVDNEVGCIYAIVECIGHEFFDYNKYILENGGYPDPDDFVYDGVSVDDPGFNPWCDFSENEAYNSAIADVEMGAYLHFASVVIDHFYNVFGRMPEDNTYYEETENVGVDELPF